MKTNIQAPLYGIILAISIVGIILLLTYSIVGKQEQPVHTRIKKSYIPVVIDEHTCLLIHGSDTIKLLLENATPLQEEYVIFVIQ